MEPLDLAAGQEGNNILEEADEVEEAEDVITTDTSPLPVDAGDVGDADEAEEPGALSLGEPLVRYNGADWLGTGVPTRADIVRACDELSTSGGVLSDEIQTKIDYVDSVFFMPTDLEETNIYPSGKARYAIRFFGPLMDGSKAEVTVTDVPVYFDVLVPGFGQPGAYGKNLEGIEAQKVLEKFHSSLRGLFTAADVAQPEFIETVHAFPVRGFHPEPVPYKRLHFPTLQARKEGIRTVRDAGHTTASDDLSAYYRKVAGEARVPLCDWAELQDYEYAPGPTEKSPLCAHIFSVPLSGYRALTDPLDAKDKRAAAEAKRASMPLLARDRTLVLGWDIETHSAREAGDLPTAEHEEDNAFAIALTAHWKDETAPLARIRLVDVESDPVPGRTTVVCGSPKNVLRAFALCWRALAPDIAVGFNDSNYDWEFIVKKAFRWKLLAWMCEKMSAAPRRAQNDDAALKWNYRAGMDGKGQKIKISPEEVFFSKYFKVPGCVPIDVRASYKRLYPKSETPVAGSLKFYLKLVGLPGKADMPIGQMWRYYRTARLLQDGTVKAPLETVAASKRNMRRVNDYCEIDALSCQRLLVRRNVVNEYREVGRLTYTSLYDCHYYADGMKVCNILRAYASRENILVSMIGLSREESGKYPGAYVFPPKKGAVPDPDRLATLEAAVAEMRDAEARGDNKAKEVAAGKVRQAFEAFAAERPVTGLDFSSLYPSIIMAYNLSPEKILLDEDEAKYWREQGLDLHNIEFDYNGRPIRGWSIRHGCLDKNIGLYPRVLIELFAKRAEMKKVMNTHGAVVEVIDLVMGRAKKDGVRVAEATSRVYSDARESERTCKAALAPDAPPPRVSPGATVAEELADFKRRLRSAEEQLEVLKRLYGMAAGENPSDEATEAVVASESRRATFDWACANTKQLALKKMMNSFYGETGNAISPFFHLALAGGVTDAGQQNLKNTADFVLSEEYKILYGDTDSLYIVCPTKNFAECDAAFSRGELSREEWWEAMVRITMRSMNTLRDKVNAHLRARNGTPYLSMAYEEVLYPVHFTAKKKYYGVPHLNEVNFRPKKLFVRGVDVVKQGLPGLTRDIGWRIMWANMAPDCKRNVHRVVEDTLRDAIVNAAQWDFEHFIKTDAWKPDKNNVAVQTFIKRMKARLQAGPPRGSKTTAAEWAALYALPDPGERFSYVMVKTGETHNLRGLVAAPKKGDQMEFARAAKAFNLEVDVAYYLTRSVAGLCARFICEHTQFQPPNAERLKEKEIDDFSTKAAKKFLIEYIQAQSGLSKAALKSRGFAYRRAFGKAAVQARVALGAAAGRNALEVLHGEWLDFELLLGNTAPDADGEQQAPDTAEDVSRLVKSVWESAEAFAGSVSGTDEWCADLAKARGIGPNGEDLSSGSSSGTSTPRGRATASPGDTSRSSSLARTPSRSASSSRSKLPATNLFRETTVVRGKRPPLVIAKLAYTRALTVAENACKASLAQMAPAVLDIAFQYETTLENLVRSERELERQAHPEIGTAGGLPSASENTLDLVAEDKRTLADFRAEWFRAAAIHLTRRQETDFTNYLSRLKSRRIGVSPAPSRAERAKTIAAAAASLRVSGELL
jgi:DNA polymerase elongation subunit (family B)